MKTPIKTKMTSFTLETLPPLTEAQRASLRQLASLPDHDIDTSDIPDMTDEQWQSARRSTLHRPLKQQITARVDADVLDWLKGQGRGYQSRLNAILRQAMLQSSKHR